MPKRASSSAGFTLLTLAGVDAPINKPPSKMQQQMARAAAAGGATVGAWATPKQRAFCKALKEKGIYKPFAAVCDDFKMECRDDEAFATDVTTSTGSVGGRLEAEGRSNYTFRVDHQQVVTGSKPRDGGPAGDRVNAVMEKLITEYEIDEIVANPENASIFNRAKKVAAQPRAIRLGQYFAAVHTEMVCDAKAALTDSSVVTYSWDRAMDAAKCFFGKRKNKFFQLGRPTTPEERVELVEISHYKDVQGIIDTFKSAWDKQEPLPGGRLVVYSNRGAERFSVWETYRFEASSASGFYSDVGTVEGSYTAGKLPAVVLKHYREKVASAPDFQPRKLPDAKLVYNWFASARAEGSARNSGNVSPMALWGKAWEIYFDDGKTIGRLDD